MRLSAWRLALGVSLAGLLQAIGPTTEAWAAGPCAATTPASGYEVVLCITAPDGPAEIAGRYTVRAEAHVDVLDLRVRRLVFYVDGTYVLTDYEAPYEFALPTEQWADGPHELGVEAIMQDDAVTPRLTSPFSIGNGSPSPAPAVAFVPRTPTPRDGRPFVVAAAGDGASGERGAADVSDSVVDWDPDLFLYLGDVYEKGTYTEFLNWYGTPASFYGRLAGITNPAIGDHEYEDGRADAYFEYWGGVPSYYSYDAGGWHFISLNSTGQFGQTSPGTPQYDWLAADLATNASACTIAYFQHPPFSIGTQGGVERMRGIWRLLVQDGVDVVLAGNDHNYQRWAPLDAGGNQADRGATLFVVGTGGHGIRGFERDDPAVVARADTNPEAMGAIRMQLGRNGAAYVFENIAGTVVDSGALTCSGAAPEAAPPTAPTAAVERLERGNVSVSWAASDDDTVVTGYQILRDGQALAEVSSLDLSIVDTAADDGPHTYSVIAHDIAGKTSPESTVEVAAAPRPTAATAGTGKVGFPDPSPVDPTPDSGLRIGPIAGVIALIVLSGVVLVVVRRTRR